MTFTARLARAGLALALASTPAFAHTTRAHHLTVAGAWTRPTPPGAAAGAGYLTITNDDAEPDRLVGGTSPAVREVQVHEMRIENGIARMRPVAGGLVIPAHGTVTLAPGGYHVMLIGPKRRLAAGVRVPATLRFQRAGDIKVSFAVRTDPPAGAR